MLASLLTATLLQTWTPEAHAGVRPFISPDLAVAIYSDGQNPETGLAAGAEAGLAYKLGSLDGKTRLGGAYIFTTGGTGNDVRLGSFLGYRPKIWGLGTGLDVFRNEYSGTSVSLDPSVGADLPVQLELGPQALHLQMGVAPTWLQESSRRVNWDDTNAFGIGHEFSWWLGAVLDIKVANLSVRWTERNVQGGDTVTGLGIGIGLGRSTE